MEALIPRKTRGHGRRWRSRVIACVIFLGASLFFVLSHFTNEGTFLKGSSAKASDNSPSSRHLLAVKENCTPAAIERFPHVSLIFNQDQRRDGAVILHIAIAAYMFLALAIICDEYFVPACETMASSLKLQEDVAGATFLAAGSSAPELATTIIGVFVTKDDIALGAVVGSAVFNVMLVPGLCALWATTVVYLRWWPLCRDSFFYMISIITLVLVIADGVVMWYDALSLVLLYVIYIAFMFFNPTLDAYFTNRCTCMPTPHDPEVVPLKVKGLEEEHHHYNLVESEDEDTVFTSLLSSSNGDLVVVNGVEDSKHNEHEYEKKHIEGEEEEEESSLCTFPKGCWPRTLWIVSLPLQVVLYVTVPDCRTERWRKWFVFTFVLSMFWIGVFSYIMVWMITVIGHTAGIPDTVMGLTFIAAGSSVPDAIASLIVVNEGHGDMAMSNAVASNVFDILLCLGLPWLIQTTLGDARHTGILIYSSGLMYCAITLLSTVVFLLVATHLNGWKLTKPYGVILVCIYGLFNLFASLYELNVFGYVHPPECPSDL